MGGPEASGARAERSADCAYSTCCQTSCTWLIMISHDAGVAGEREAFGSMVADARDVGVVGGPEASRARAADAHDIS